MTTHELERQVEQLERAFNAAPARERLKIAPRVQQIACKLDARHESIPRPLQRIKTTLEQDAFDDKFENMPV